LTERPPTALTSPRHNQSRLRHNNGRHPLIETVDLSEQTETLQFFYDGISFNFPLGTC
jgi:hypothetical protein